MTVTSPSPEGMAPPLPEATALDPAATEAVALTGLSGFIHRRRANRIEEHEQKHADAFVDGLIAHARPEATLSAPKMRKLQSAENRVKAVEEAQEKIRRRAEVRRSEGLRATDPRPGVLEKLKKERDKLHPETPHKKKAEKHLGKAERLKKKNEELVKRDKTKNSRQAIRKQNRYIRSQVRAEYVEAGKEIGKKGVDTTKRVTKATGRSIARTARIVHPDNLQKGFEHMIDAPVWLATQVTPHVDRWKEKSTKRKAARGTSRTRKYLRPVVKKGKRAVDDVTTARDYLDVRRSDWVDRSTHSSKERRARRNKERREQTRKDLNSLADILFPEAGKSSGSNKELPQAPKQPETETKAAAQSREIRPVYVAGERVEDKKQPFMTPEAKRAMVRDVARSVIRPRRKKF